MQMERRALYNSLRLNWLQDPTIAVKPWQVDDYRTYSLEKLFEGLKSKGYALNKASFLALAENADTPEDLTDDLLADSELDATDQDFVYLHLFELWRTLLPEKTCLSIFCDELDYQIDSYDQAKSLNAESIQDVIANLEVILDENTDEGADPIAVFETISAGCASNIESFLYDYISEQIDFGNISYASELLDDFIDYVKDLRWFEFLKARILINTDPLGTYETIRQLIQDAKDEPDLEFNLELLSFMVQGGEGDLLAKLVQQTYPLLEMEEDFQDVLNICADYFSCLDQDKKEQEIQTLIQKRKKRSPQEIIEFNDPDFKTLMQIIDSPNSI